VNEVGLWILDGVALATLLADVVTLFLFVLAQVRWGVRLRGLPKHKVRLRKSMLLGLDRLLVCTLWVWEARMDRVLVSLVGQLLLVTRLIIASHDGACSDAWLEFEDLLCALGLGDIVHWRLVEWVLHRFVLHGGLARGPASLAKTLLLIFYGHSLSLGGVLGLDRLNGLRVDHVSVLRSNIKVGGLHDALSLGNFNFLFRFVCLVLEVEVGVVGGADGMRCKTKLL
jgi:hypothetical protein